MPLLTTVASGGVKGLGWSSPPLGEELGGMVLVTPTSIAYTGTSATVGANGSVEFSACTYLSLNGVFSADYDNYMIVCRTSSGSNYLRLRSSGTDNVGATSYTSQLLSVLDTAIFGSRGTGDNTYINYQKTSSPPLGYSLYVYGPYLAQPTAGRSVTLGTYNADLRITDHAWTHDQSTSYDGISFSVGSQDMTGLMSVYGLVGA
jgi:hypothetical protein